MVAPNRPKALPRSLPRNSNWISPDTCGLRIPPAAPWISRETTSSVGPREMPQAAEARVKMVSPTRKLVRRPRASPTRPDGTSERPKVSAYPETTQDRSAEVAPRPRWIEGSATLTIETSSSVMKPTVRHTASARQRRGSGV